MEMNQVSALLRRYTIFRAFAAASIDFSRAVYARSDKIFV